MSAIGEFFHMGGYAGFIWSAYAVATVVLGGLIVISLKQLRAREREAAAMEAANPRRARRDTETETGKESTSDEA